MPRTPFLQYLDRYRTPVVAPGVLCPPRALGGEHAAADCSDGYARVPLSLAPQPTLSALIDFNASVTRDLCPLVGRCATNRCSASWTGSCTGLCSYHMRGAGAGRQVERCLRRRGGAARRHRTFRRFRCRCRHRQCRSAPRRRGRTRHACATRRRRRRRVSRFPLWTRRRHSNRSHLPRGGEGRRLTSRASASHRVLERTTRMEARGRQLSLTHARWHVPHRSTRLHLPIRAARRAVVTPQHTTRR